MDISSQDYFLPNNFCALPAEFSNFEHSKVVIMPIPYEQTTSYKKGTQKGPSAIIRASQNLELYDDELDKEIYTIGICTLPELIPDLADYRKNLELIEEVTTSIITKEKFPVALGGEHTISVGLVKSFAKTKTNFSVLQLDAHADLRQSYQDTPYNHACVMRRILDYTPAVQVGIRSVSKKEADFAKSRKLPIYYARDLQKSNHWMDNVLSDLEENVYITIDLDVFDPSIIPAVGTPEPGGLDWYVMLELLHHVAKEKNILGFDVVELCPQPGQHASDFAAAKLIYKLLGYIF